MVEGSISESEYASGGCSVATDVSRIHATRPRGRTALLSDFRASSTRRNSHRSSCFAKARARPRRASGARSPLLRSKVSPPRRFRPPRRQTRARLSRARSPSFSSAERPGGENRAAVEVGAVRGLTAEEIVARERAWDAGQRERLQSFTAHMKTSLRFRIAEVNETFDLTIEGPFFMRRGEPADWKWEQFYLNGVRWKQRTLPKLPILQPEKVTTLPRFGWKTTLHAARRVDRLGTPRLSHHLLPRARLETSRSTAEASGSTRKISASAPRLGPTNLSRPSRTSRRRSIARRQVTPRSFCPSRSRGAGLFDCRAHHAIERDAVMTAVEVNPPTFPRAAQAYASDAQMIETPKGDAHLILTRRTRAAARRREGLPQESLRASRDLLRQVAELPDPAAGSAVLRLRFMG